MYLSKKELQKMEQADIRETAAEELADISGIEIDMEKPVPARVEEYVQKVGNPFLVRVGEYVVKIGYSDQAGTLNERMQQYIRKAARIKY